MGGAGGKWVPNNIAEYFFFDEYGFLSINERKIRDCYHEFTQAMGLVYGNIRSIYNELASVALNQDDIRKATNDLKMCVTADIEMKGLEYFFTKEKKEAQQSQQPAQVVSKKLQSDMTAIKKAQPIVVNDSKEDDGGEDDG